MEQAKNGNNVTTTGEQSRLTISKAELTLKSWGGTYQFTDTVYPDTTVNKWASVANNGDDEKVHYKVKSFTKTSISYELGFNTSDPTPENSYADIKIYTSDGKCVLNEHCTRGWGKGSPYSNVYALSAEWT